jgi:hypothetical protein
VRTTVQSLSKGFGDYVAFGEVKLECLAAVDNFKKQVYSTTNLGWRVEESAGLHLGNISLIDD